MARGAVVELRVSGTGTGIAADELPFIFDRNYRADRAHQRSDSGASGRGLTIAKAIVEAHRGTITAESQVGRGGTFIITLPAHSSGG